MTIPHTCAPGWWCALCDHNERNGVPRNHPDAPRRPKAMSTATRRSLPVRGPCLHLGARTEFRPGCGGRLCAHACDAGEPVAVPGGVCQTCRLYEPEQG